MHIKRLSVLSLVLAAAVLFSTAAYAAPAALPSDPVPNPNTLQWFPQTSHTIRGAFREYWLSQGGLNRFGYPLTEEFTEASTDGKNYTVQFFERARFEWHPENQSPYNILLTQLGHIVTAGRGNEVGFQPTRAIAGQRFFAETGHNVTEIFYQYWLRNGGLRIYGYPISEPIIERSPTNGKFYQVQYFERNRFEYHPELANSPVLLGLLGTQILKDRGWIH